MAYADERSAEAAQLQRRILKKAFASGVKVITGSDSNPIDEKRWWGGQRISGTVEVGKIADLIIVQENPLDHISNLRKLSMVFKDGVQVI